NLSRREALRLLAVTATAALVSGQRSNRIVQAQPPEPMPTPTSHSALETGTVLLDGGYNMPRIGLRPFRLSDSQCENSVYHLLCYGGRLIDTARIYGNESAVGRAIQRAIDEGFVTREEIFVTTKMWTSDFDDGDNAIDASLER